MSFNKNQRRANAFPQSFVSTPDTSHMSFNKNQRRANAFPQSFVSHTPDTSHMSFNKNQRRANAFPPELRLTHRTRPTWALTRIREEPMLFLRASSHTQDTSHMSFNKNQRRANAFPPELRLTHRTRPTWALTRIREEPMLFLQSFVSHTQDTSHMSFNKNQRRANAFPPELRHTHTGHVPHEL